MTKGLSRKITVFLFIAISLIAICLESCGGRDAGIVKATRLLMGTIVEIEVPLGRGVSGERIRAATEMAFSEIERVERVFTVFDPDSEISRINRLKAGKTLKISAEVFSLIEEARYWNEKTAGAFDITVKPLVQVWNAAKKNKRMPTKEEVNEALAKVGSGNMVLDKAARTISFTKEKMGLDLGGIAKGYATYRAVMVLKESGISDAIVNSGGDMYCLGRRKVLVPWKVGIQHPRKKYEAFFRLELEDKAVDTSGDYEKFFILNGRRYSHIIDPRTGYPVGDGVVSATVIADDSTAADALATSLCVLGEEGLEIVSALKGAEAAVIIKEGNALKVKTTKGFSSKYGVIKEGKF